MLQKLFVLSSTGKLNYIWYGSASVATDGRYIAIYSEMHHSTFYGSIFKPKTGEIKFLPSIPLDEISLMDMQSIIEIADQFEYYYAWLSQAVEVGKYLLEKHIEINFSK